MSEMETEAAEFFAARSEAQNKGDTALNPVAPALEKAAAKTEAPPAKPTAPAEKPATPATGKVPGAPTFTKPALSKTEPSTNGTADSAKDQFADIPREYKSGSIRAVNWDKLHAKADHYEALSVQRASELEALQTQLSEARLATSSAAPSPEVATRLQSLQQERDALQAKLEAVAVERSPRFEAQFKPRRESALAQAKAAVGPADAAKVEALLNLGESSYRDEQIEAFLSSLSPLRATKLTQAVADLDRLLVERNALASQGSELWKTWVAEENANRERANTERIAKVNSTFEAELKEWEPVGLSKDDIANARSVYSGQGATMQDASRAALWAVAGPKAAQMAQDLQAKVTELEGELAKLRKIQPGVGAAGGGALPTESADDDDSTTTGYAERIARQAMRGGVRFGV